LKKVLIIILATLLIAEARLSPLAPRPDWTRLDPYQQTITREDFQNLLNRVYAPAQAWAPYISLSDSAAEIRTGATQAPYILRFAEDQSNAKPVPTFWRSKTKLPAAMPQRPLEGLKITLDPGHLGGDWAMLEERWFRVGNSAPVVEGDMVLKVALILAPQLRSLGATVSFTRSKPGPVTSKRPADLQKEALLALRDKRDPVSDEALAKEANRLFYRASEIRRRAQLVNHVLKPDLVLCLHFNAEAWGNEKEPTLVEPNHLHFLITGAWNREELDYEDQRLEMLVKLLNRSFHEELRVTDALAASLAKATGLPPYLYQGTNAIRVNDNPYVWARNLLANRLFTCPVVYIEPYVMNSHMAFSRIQAGDYDGRRNFGGVMRRSIYREYADGVVAGLVDYYGDR